MVSGYIMKPVGGQAPLRYSVNLYFPDTVPMVGQNRKCLISPLINSDQSRWLDPAMITRSSDNEMLS